ncbi:MAG: pantetheine-phosphate adenylyltransferase, partial [Oscillospiraceae bacterium]
MRIAICPGSFDPVTKGHLDIIRRATTLFDKVIIGVSVNPNKKGCFTLEERVNLIKKCTTDIPNIEIDIVDTLLAEYAKKVKACAIVKGLRAVTDFEYEFQMTALNYQLNKNIETFFVMSPPQYMYLSSSIVREIASLQGDIDQFV